VSDIHRLRDMVLREARLVAVSIPWGETEERFALSDHASPKDIALFLWACHYNRDRDDRARSLACLAAMCLQATSAYRLKPMLPARDSPTEIRAMGKALLEGGSGENVYGLARDAARSLGLGSDT
jgi:hypothetical protein